MSLQIEQKQARKNLCHGLCWKEQFYDVGEDVTLPPHEGAHFWCVYTQTCMGPDGNLANPENCTSLNRVCYVVLDAPVVIDS